MGVSPKSGVRGQVRGLLTRSSTATLRDFQTNSQTAMMQATPIPPINTTNTPPTFARPSSLAVLLLLDVSSCVTNTLVWDHFKLCKSANKGLYRVDFCVRPLIQLTTLNWNYAEITNRLFIIQRLRKLTVYLTLFEWTGV